MKRLLHSITHMCPAALYGIRTTLALCCCMVFAAFVVCLCAGEPCIANFSVYRTVAALTEMPAGLLLLAGIGAVILQFGP
jgi:hypothetical protein